LHDHIRLAAFSGDAMATQNDMTVRGGEIAASPVFLSRHDPIAENDLVTDHDDPPRQSESFIKKFIHHLLATLSTPNV